MKSLCKIVLYNVLAWNMIADVLGLSLRSLQSTEDASVTDGDVQAAAATCTETAGCDPQDPTKVLVCDTGKRLLGGSKKPKTFCSKLSGKVSRWLKNGRATCGNCKAPTPAGSCREVMTKGQTTSGLYQLSVNGGPKFFAYCDQKTKEGGWMLFLSYKHYSADVMPINANTLPTDPENGYSHIQLKDVGYAKTNIQSLLFYCTCSTHNRKIHFTNNNPDIIQTAFDGTGVGTAASWSSTTYTDTLNDHTGKLPINTVSVTTGTLTANPFSKTGASWSVGVQDKTFNCDNDQNYPSGTWFPQDAHHQVWVRMAS